MPFKISALFCAFTLLPAFAQVLPPDLHFHPVHELNEHLDGTADTNNWAGYAVTGGTFTSATGSWNVPAVVCSGVAANNPQFAAAWVGIDGYTSNTVEQTGTLSWCSGTTPLYNAWYEFYPAGMVTTTLAVSPGNVISASVTYAGTTFTLKITNVTTGKSFTMTGAAPTALRTSAEWIMEAPCCTATGTILPLANFGTAVFGGDYTKQTTTNDAVGSLHSGKISAFPAANVIQIKKGPTATSPQESTCSPLSSDGTSFSCAWAAK